MKFMTTREAVEKWNISERRIRQLLQDGRIEGAVKVGNSWNIPIDADKPVDKRIIKPDDNKFIIDLDDNYFNEVDSLKKELDSKRPIPKETLNSLRESINLEWTYNSNGIEGNTLTLRETQVVLEGITVGGKSIKEHLEAHKKTDIENKFVDDMLDAISKQTEIDIPEEMVEDEINHLIKRFEEQLKYQGVSLDLYYSLTKSTEKDFREQVEKNMVNTCMNNKMKEFLSLVQDDIDELNQEAQEAIEKAKREVKE